MTKLQLLEILNRKFPDLNFYTDPYSHYLTIKAHNSHIQFYSYSVVEEDESTIWYFQVFFPDREIQIPNEGTEFFFDYISETIYKFFLIEKLKDDVSDFINKVNSLDYKRSFAINKIIEN